MGVQGFFIMVCVGIYAVLVNEMVIAANLHSAIFSIAAYTVIHAIISNVSNQTQELSKGSRVGQLVITPVVIADFVTELGEQRGTDGFGSTGK